MLTIAPPLRRATVLILRGLHLIGLAAFFGVIVADIVIDRYAETQNAAFLADARVLVSLTGLGLPLRGLALALVSGLAMTALRYGGRPPAWAVAKLALTVAIFANALALLFPAIAEATHWAAASAEQGRVLPEYFAAVGREGVYGAANLAMFLVAGALGVVRPAFRRRRDAG